MFKPLYDALVSAGTPGSIQLKSGHHLQIVQHRNLGENNSTLLEVVYSVVPWPASPDTPVLYFTVSKISIGQNTFAEQDDEESERNNMIFPEDDEDSLQAHSQHIEPVSDISQIVSLLVPDSFVDQLTNAKSNLENPSSFSDTNYLLPIPPLSQAEHPATGLPAFYLHPCNTHDFIKNELTFLKDQQNADQTFKLYMWLQTFGRTVGLEIPEFHPSLSR